jgi:NAD(P)H-flavin reductase
MNDFAATAVIDAWDETAALRAVRVDLGERRGAHTLPGQVVRLRADGLGDGYFALASAPAADGHADLLIKRGAPLADALVSAAGPGARLDMTSAFGKGFPLEAARGRELLLFAAGSGISPIRALVEHVLARRADYGRAALFYGQRGHEDFAYQKEHAAWHAAGVRVVLCSSQPQPDWDGPRGYVQDVAHSLGFLDIDTRGAVAYLCGMKTMVAAVKDVLARAQVAPERIFQNF